MQIIIPMSGFGERFRRAGYKKPKPLIEVEGKPIIAHVIDMFPGEKDFTFICNRDHLDSPGYEMREILQHYCPTGSIIGIEPHKLGPVFAVSKVQHLFDPTRPAVVNYCDFTCYWDWQHFKNYVHSSKCFGCIPAYKGFHPHSLGTTNYAYMLESNGWVKDIQEKQPFTDARINEYASSGTYYFNTAELMLNSFEYMSRHSLTVNGEFYVSLAYKFLIKQNKSIAVYPLQHFMQWGTPADLSEYNYWSSSFKRLLDVTESSGSTSADDGAVLIPMAGLGKRFANEGYNLTKPLIPVSGRSMVSQAANDLPHSKRYIFVLRADMPGYTDVKEEITNLYPHSIITTIDSVTEGQACSALIGLDSLPTDESFTSITIGACDNGLLYDMKLFKSLSNDPSIDIIVWGIRNYASAIRNPKMYGWIDSDNGWIRSISVKCPLNSPETDPIVLGAFTFRRSEDYRRAMASLVHRDGKINGEFYIDSLINDAISLGLKCHLFEVDSYLCWGTPNDLRTFEYWQSCFHKWKSHPYQLELDRRIPPKEVNKLAQIYSSYVPPLLHPIND